MTRLTDDLRDETTEVSSGNVFADLGLPEPDQALLKAELARTISEIIERRRLTQAGAAQILGVDQPKVSALIRGQLSGFSVERMLRFLGALGNDIEVVVRQAPPTRTPTLTVTAS